MSGATIGGVVGAVVGSFIPGVGTQLGWMVGSMIGGYVDPEQISQFGPRLTDASQQTARDGIPIPYGYGTFPCHGNIIWCGPVVEHVNESTDDGKGSGVETTTTTYSYTRSYAIGICQGEIAGLLTIKRNGKIIFDARTDAELTAIGYTSAQIAEARAATAKANVRFTVYTGSETQTADPTIEAHEGVGNVPGFRGLAYIVVTDDDVTELRGAVPQYEFVVRVSGTVNECSDVEEGLLAWWPLDDASGGGVARELVGGYNGVYSTNVGSGGPLQAAGSGSAVFSDFGQYMIVEDVFNHLESPGSYDAWTATVWARVDEDIAGSVLKRIAGYMTGSWTAGTHAFEFSLRNGINNMRPRVAYGWGGTSTTALAKSSDVSEGARMFIGMEWEADAPASGTGTFRFYLNGELEGESTGVPRPASSGVHMEVGGGFQFPESYQFLGAVSDLKYYNIILGEEGHRSRYLPSGTSDLYDIPDAPGWYVRADGTLVERCSEQIEGSNPTLDTIVAAEFQRVGLTSDDYDVSDLAGIEVLGYRVLPNGAGVDAALGPLMQAYFFDIAEWDGKLRCVLRGGASSLPLTMDDLAERDGEAIEWTRVQEAELLRVVTVGYMDPAAGYSPTTQKWERRAGTVQAKGEAAVQVPITADADAAAGIAKIRGLIAWAETEKGKLSLPYRHAKVTPTDILTLTDDAGEAHRLRVGQIEDDSGVRLLEVTKERGSVYGATATGVIPNNPTGPNGGGIVGPTIAHLMNLPSLRSSDTVPGFYAGVTGLLPGWQGADIYISADGGVSYQFAKRILSRATLGKLVSAIDTDDEPITVALFDNRSLSTITSDQLAARQNAFSIGEEVGQFQTAAENVDEDWELTDTVRGQLGTTAASHVADAEWTLLDGAVQLVPVDVAHAGTTLKVKAVSLGTTLDDATAVDFVFDPPTFIRDGGVVTP